jgi:hypothetical protein
MSYDEPSVPLIVYLFADRLIPWRSGLSPGTHIPCCEHDVETSALATSLFATAFWSLWQHGLIEMEIVEHPHAKWSSHRVELRVRPLERRARPGLEGEVMGGLRFEEDIGDVVGRWSSMRSTDPWHDAIREVAAEALAGGYLRQIESKGGVLARWLLRGAELEPDRRRIASLEGQFDRFNNDWSRFRVEGDALHDRLIEGCRRSLMACTECWYA